MLTPQVATHRAKLGTANAGGWARQAPTRLALVLLVGLATAADEAQAKHVGPVNTMFRWIGVCYSVGYHAQECCPCAAAGQPLYGSPCAQGYLNPQPRGPIVLPECGHGMYSPSHLYWQGDAYPGQYPYQGEMITAPTEVTAPDETAAPTEAAPANDPPPAGPDEVEPAPEPAPAPAPSAASPRGPRYRSTKASRSTSGASSTRSSRGQRYVPGPQRSSAVQSR